MVMYLLHYCVNLYKPHVKEVNYFSYWPRGGSYHYSFINQTQRFKSLVETSISHCGYKEASYTPVLVHNITLMSMILNCITSEYLLIFLSWQEKYFLFCTIDKKEKFENTLLTIKGKLPPFERTKPLFIKFTKISVSEVENILCLHQC